MTDQPTTPTVDTDELRLLLRRARTVIEAETGTEYPNLLLDLDAALARPVPAAPAEPTDTDRLREVADLDERSGAPVGAALLAAADEIDRLRAPLPEIRCPLCSKRIDFGTALTRVDGAIAHEVCPAPAEPGATEVERPSVAIVGRGPGLVQAAQAWSRQQIEQEAAALAASPAPAGEHVWTHDGSMVLCERCGIELPIEDDAPTIWVALVSKCEGPG